MEDKYEEGIIKGAEEMKLLENTKLKEKGKCICKINGNKIGTGFFCKIIYKNELIPVLITNYHIIDDNFIESKNNIKIYINEDYKFIKINKNKKIYSSPNNEYDIIIIRLEEDEIKHYLEIDENIFKHNSELAYKDEPIYILHHPLAGKAKVSYGKGIEKIDEHDIKHLCSTEEGSSGSPILSSFTDKIIGIHRGFYRTKGYNYGTFLKFPLNELNGNKNKNEIICIYNKQEDEIYLLYDYSRETEYWDDEEKKSYIEGKNNINGNNIDIYINDKLIEFNYKYKSYEKGEIKVKFIFNELLTSTSYMFFGCSSLSSIDLSSFNTSNSNNMSRMFFGCSSLKSVNLSSFNTTNVKDMRLMFYGCSSLESIDLSSFKTNNVNDMNGMFYKCSSLKSIDLSSFDITNVKDMSLMFFGCSSLKSINLTSFNTTNVTNMNWMFSECSSLKKENVKINDNAKIILN